MNGPWNDTDTWAVESGWPGSGDTAYIGGILTVQLATFSTDCAKLFMDGGTVDIGSGSLLRTTEELNMSGGGLSGAGTLLNDGIFTRSGTADHMINCTVTNTGTVNHQDAGGLTVGGAFNNAAAAEYYLHGDGGINGGGIFRNFGLLAKTGGTGTSAASTTFHNAGGTLAVSSGRLRLTGSGTFQSGTYFADEDGVLEFAGNSVLTGTLQGTGTGEVRWTAGTWGSGTDATLAISNFCWRGGELNGHVANDGRFSLDASATGTVKHATLDNRALVRHSSGTLRLLAESGGTSTVNNEDGAAWEIVTNGVFLSGGTGWGNTWFNNFGCLAKTGGDGISRLDLDTSAGLAYGGFCNFGGAIEVRSGRLELAAEGVYSNGIYTAAAGAVLHLGGGIDNLGRMTFDAANATNTVWHGGLKNSGLLRQTGGILRI
ncbi:MAG: hypothetical protein PHV28_12555, partial [Kiritimatiellae bacterium]|nr:hypothetical protein [Kiritimatiellia bacterium]